MPRMHCPEPGDGDNTDKNGGSLAYALCGAKPRKENLATSDGDTVNCRTCCKRLNGNVQWFNCLFTTGIRFLPAPPRRRLHESDSAYLTRVNNERSLWWRPNAARVAG